MFENLNIFRHLGVDEFIKLNNKQNVEIATKYIFIKQKYIQSCYFYLFYISSYKELLLLF